MIQTSLFEIDDISIQSNSVADIVSKSKGKTTETDVNKILKSKKISLKERLAIINERVISVLGKQKANVVVIKTREQLHDYITACIKSGYIAIDTETNNSLDPVTCKLMGPCFYYPGGKQAYVPLNHVNPDTMERLPWQLTEKDIREELQRIIDAKTFVIMHNGKFDYEVLYCTCGIRIKPNWDTIVGSRLWDENEKASLKEQYIKKVDKTQKKYDIDNLFKGVAYAVVDPDIFALYAATDSMMTYKLFELQFPYFTAPEQERLYWVFTHIEMPIVIVTAEMEMRGVYVDQDYAARIKAKYDTQLADLDSKIETKIDLLEPLIKAWRLTKAANAKTKVYEPKKSKKTAEQIEADFPYFDEEKGKRYKWGKARVSQLEGRISLSSPAQLAILFYDILKCPEVSNKNARGTGSNELKAFEKKLKDEKEVAEMIEKAVRMFVGGEVADSGDDTVEEAKTVKATESKDNLTFFADDDDLEQKFWDETDEEESDEADTDDVKVSESAKITEEYVRELYAATIPVAQSLCKAILDRRGLMKLLTTYIDVIPELTKHWPDGRIRFHLNSLGTDTGRYSSGGKLKFMENGEAVEVSGINIQNIPSHNKDIRMLFRAKPGYKLVGSDYSAQEPRLTAFISQDPKMIEAYLKKQDLYAVIAQSAFDNEYKDNLEFWPAGTELEIDGKKVVAGNKTHKNPGGKDRRSVGKVLLLASTYGMSGSTAGQRLNKSADEGQELLDKFFGMFTKVDETIKNSQKQLKEVGYVEDPFGRRRHLPAVYLPSYEVRLKTTQKDLDANFNPLFGCTYRKKVDPRIIKWQKAVEEKIASSQEWQAKKAAEKGKTWTPNGEMSNKQYEKLAKEALKDGVIIQSWTGKKAQALRQCFNARIQGGAASLTKLAMVAIENDKQMNEWDAHLVITVHDEVLVECPEEYADLVEKRLPEIMVNAAKDNGINVPMACDPYNVTHWYEDEAAAAILDELKKLEEGGMSHDDAVSAIYARHTEHKPETITRVITGETDQLEF